MFSSHDLSAYLDSEQRLVAAKVIKRFILHAKKTGFVVEHDFIMATYLADRWDMRLKSVLGDHKDSSKGSFSIYGRLLFTPLILFWAVSVVILIVFRVIVFEGSPSVETTANSPQSLLSGMNKFLEQLKVTFR